MARDYKDQATLYQMYHGEHMDMEEIADELGCTGVTVSNWMRKHGIPKARAEERKAYLEWMYHDKRHTQEEIAGLLNSAQTTIGNFMREHGIETLRQADRQPPSIYFSTDGYLTCRHRVGEERYAFRVHRLQAVAEYGFSAVAGNEIHHKNGMKVDNRPENLEPISKANHVAEHHERGDLRPPQIRD